MMPDIDATLMIDPEFRKSIVSAKTCEGRTVPPIKFRSKTFLPGVHVQIAKIIAWLQRRFGLIPSGCIDQDVDWSK